MKGKKYSDKDAFMKEIESIIGHELTAKYCSLLLKFGIYKKRKRKSKLAQIIINRYEDCPVDRSQLPDDVVSKGHDYKTVQDTIIKLDNVEFKREVYYSPSLNKSYLGAVPQGYEGEFGPNINSDIISMKYVNPKDWRILPEYRNCDFQYVYFKSFNKISCNGDIPS